MLKSLITIPALIACAVVFVVLFVILGVTLWVSIIAAVAAFLIGGAVRGGMGHAGRPHTGHA